MTQHLGARFAPKAPLRDRAISLAIPAKDRAWFWAWVAWCDQGHYLPHRPPSAPRKIPAWAKARYLIHVGAKPTPTPPPTPVPVPPPPPSHDQFERFKRAIIAAQNPETALGTAHNMPIFLTADPAYAGFATADFLARARAQGRGLGVWCNPSQVSVGHLREFARGLGIPETMLMGQGETADEFDITLDAKLPSAVGNLSALRQDQRDRINADECAWLQEDYWNVQPWLQPNWMNTKVVCVEPGLYFGEGPYGRYQPVPDFIATGRISIGRDGFYHASGPHDAGHDSDYAVFA
jgi:hypothetical protein